MVKLKNILISNAYEIMIISDHVIKVIEIIYEMI